MLAHLRVRDLVLIDVLDIDLSPKFNVLTGETGAGKSLVATAVDLLLGRRAAGEMVRRGCEEAEVEGIFDITDEPEVKTRLENAGLPEEDELLIRRVIPAKGRHKCYVNGRLASLGLLSHLAEGLARVTSQHEQLTLSEPQSRLTILDGFGGLFDIAQEMSDRFEAFTDAETSLKSLQEKERDRAGRLDYLKYQLDEINRIAPTSGELEVIEQDVAKLKHQAQLSETSIRAIDDLYEGNRAAFELITASANALEDMSRHDPALAPCAESLSDAAAVVEDVARTLSRYERTLSADPQQLDELIERQEALKNLTRKHGMPLDDIIEEASKLEAEIATLEAYDVAMSDARQLVDRTRLAALDFAKSLSKKRKQAAKKLSKRVVSELQDLMFNGPDFEVRIESDEKTLGKSGVDQVGFYVALNPGEGAHPIQKTASGGELSRLMLAIKRAVAGVGPVGTYIFDEVDSGIGGPVASAVGRKLKEVAACHQVICITHLPQIAGMADYHLFVSKREENGRTATDIAPLSKTARVEELARMLAGDQVTAKTRAAAKELIAS